MLKKFGKPEWATKKDCTSGDASSSSNVLAAESIKSSASASVTLSHDDFEHLCTLADGDKSLPSAAIVKTGISENPKSLHNSWLTDSGATDHLTSSPRVFYIFTI